MAPGRGTLGLALVSERGSFLSGSCSFPERESRGYIGLGSSRSQVQGIGEFQGCGCGLHPGGVGSTRLPSEGLVPGCDVGELPEPSCPRTSTAQARCDLSSGTRRGAMEHAEGSPQRALSRMGAEGGALSTAGHLQRRTGPGAHHGAAPRRGAGVGAPGRCSAEESGCALGARTCHGLGRPCRGIPPHVSPLRPATRSRGGTLAGHTQERPGH
ncbi:LOW QUALITY PROTEIN: ZNF74 isoform 4 [Pan troglodytes]|uniref:ZNF74 isoform 4 n=1 Tax=Pan troglodytes TaxID=9598 RepID=A0A2J8IK44_PANTR|nr:LOW QUALITY PROTEIN: ZNF74 isoform 4 [Pan troglodytes]